MKYHAWRFLRHPCFRQNPWIPWLTTSFPLILFPGLRCWICDEKGSHSNYKLCSPKRTIYPFTFWVSPIFFFGLVFRSWSPKLKTLVRFFDRLIDYLKKSLAKFGSPAGDFFFTLFIPFLSWLSSVSIRFPPFLNPYVFFPFGSSPKTWHYRNGVFLLGVASIELKFPLAFKKNPFPQVFF